MSRAHSSDRCPSGLQDKTFAAVVEGMKQLPSCICLLTALGTEPTSLQITALAECIQIITTQRPSPLLLLRHFLSLHVTRKHLFEGWASHQFRSTWIYGKVRRFISQVVLFFLSLWGVFEVVIARLLLSQEGFWSLSGYLSSWVFAFFYFISSFITSRYFTRMLSCSIYLHSNCCWHSISQYLWRVNVLVTGKSQTVQLDRMSI